jgi:hypothetical protein
MQAPSIRPRDAVASARRAVRWSLGAPLELWRYVSRDVPVHRSEVAAPDEVFEVTPLSSALADGVQPITSGVGPYFHRTYTVRIEQPLLAPEQVIGGLERNFGGTTPGGMVEVDEPEAARYEVGDELRIHLSGPWDAPVRVIDTAPARFRFATLQGHMEAGEIEFRATADEVTGELEVTIDSWARSADHAFAMLYHPLGIAKEIQLHMWATVLERLAARSGGTIVDGIRVVTRRRDLADD